MEDRNPKLFIPPPPDVREKREKMKKQVKVNIAVATLSEYLLSNIDQAQVVTSL